MRVCGAGWGRWVLAAVVAVLVLVGGADADDSAAEGGGVLPDYRLDLSTTAGYRLVDIDGAKAKYREDYNLRSGGRLFNVRVSGLSTAPETTPVDRFRLEIDTPGDEPMSHFRLSAADRDRYDLRAAFTRSKYVYAVPQLFERPVAGDARTDDLHDFDFVRTNGSVDLTVRAPQLPTLHLGYRLFQRSGDAISTARIPGGDTFLLEAPVDAVTHVGRVGTEFRALGTEVSLQQEYRRVNRRHTLRTPLGPAGLDPTDGSTLAAYRSDRDEHLDIPATTVRLRRPLGEAVELEGAYFYSHADLGFERTRRRQGTANVPGFGGRVASAGEGGAELSTHVADLGATVRASERVRVHTSYRFNERSQGGSFDETSAFGTLALRTGDHVRAHSLTADVEVEPRADLTLRAGGRYSRRDANFSVSGQDIATDALGAIGGVRYRPWSAVDLIARYEHAQLDDPFTVPGDPQRSPALPEREVALTFTNRATAGVRLTPWRWVEVSYQLVADSRENDSFGARSRGFGNSVALAVNPLPALSVFASYTRRDLSNRADILVAPLYGRAASVQDGTEDVFVTELRYDFTLLGQAWATGWDVVLVNADNALRPRLEADAGRRAFFDLDRIDGGAFLTLRHSLLEPTIEVRLIDYNERVLPRNDYRATIVGLKVTKRFSF
jgi:hypothetical protein